MRKWYNFDLSLLAAILSAFFAIINFVTEDGSAISGGFFAAFAFFFVLDFLDKIDLWKQIDGLEEELKKEKQKAKNQKGE